MCVHIYVYIRAPTSIRGRCVSQRHRFHCRKRCFVDHISCVTGRTDLRVLSHTQNTRVNTSVNASKLTRLNTKCGLRNGVLDDSDILSGFPNNVISYGQHPKTRSRRFSRILERFLDESNTKICSKTNSVGPFGHFFPSNGGVIVCRRFSVAINQSASSEVKTSFLLPLIIHVPREDMSKLRFN